MIRNTEMTSNEALIAAIIETGLENDSPRCTMISCENNLYEICLRTDYQIYDIYLDALSREILGLNTEPVLDYEELYGEGHIVRTDVAA